MSSVNIIKAIASGSKIELARISKVAEPAEIRIYTRIQSEINKPVVHELSIMADGSYYDFNGNQNALSGKEFKQENEAAVYYSKIISDAQADKSRQVIVWHNLAVSADNIVFVSGLTLIFGLRTEDLPDVSANCLNSLAMFMKFYENNGEPKKYPEQWMLIANRRSESNELQDLTSIKEILKSD